MSDLLGLTEVQTRVGLGAMKAVAAANGFTDEERTLLRACAKVLDLVDEDLEALPAATPGEAAAAFGEDQWRHRLLHALVATAMVDGEVTREETDIVDGFAAALEVKDAWVKNLHRIVDGQWTRLRIDMVRRIPLVRKTLSAIYEEEGLRGVWKFFATARGKGALDNDLAWRFKQLGLLPANTLGYEFWHHMTERKYAFPGEPGAIVMERNVHHDLTHVLCGFSTEPEGECQVGAFLAGYMKQDPFAFVFMTMVMFNIGVSLNPGLVIPAKLQWDPEKVIRAMQRGAAINTDLTEWDFWPEMDKPIDDVRRRINLLP